MKRIDEDIRSGNYRRVYLLYGEEQYLLRQYCHKLQKHMLPEDDTMNYHVFEGNEVLVAEVIDLAETLPFFAERRVIYWSKSGLFAKGGEELAEYLPKAPESTTFLFAEEETDKRSRLYKTVAKLGTVVEFTEQKESDLMRWIGSRLKTEGKQITRGAYELFIERTGTDMETIDKELEKLVCYCMDKESIEAADVEAVTTVQIANRIFDMVDAIAEHRGKEALLLYYDLLALKESPMRILYLIIRQFQILLIVKTMAGQGFSHGEIAKKAGCPEWAVRSKYRRQCRYFPVERLKAALGDGAEYEEAVKTGRLDDKLAVELMILSYSAESAS